MIGAILPLLITACSTPRIRIVEKPIFIPPAAQERCKVERLDPNLHFASEADEKAAIKSTAIDAAGVAVKCDGKNVTLVKAITGGNEN